MVTSCPLASTRAKSRSVREQTYFTCSSLKVMMTAHILTCPVAHNIPSTTCTPVLEHMRVCVCVCATHTHSHTYIHKTIHVFTHAMTVTRLTYSWWCSSLCVCVCVCANLCACVFVGVCYFQVYRVSVQWFTSSIQLYR